MDETKRRLSLRALVATVAVALVVAVYLAATAFASGGSGSTDRSTGDRPAAATVQSQNEAPDHDCPNRGSAPEQSSDV
jgi:hypothetical protein